jgi:hypothetical protein
MPGAFIEEDLDEMYNTDEFAVNASCGGNTFAVFFHLEDSPADMFGNVVENAQPWIQVRTKHSGVFAKGVLVTIGEASDTGTGFADDVVIDITDSSLDITGERQYYVSDIKNYGGVGLEKQILLSKDKP